MFGIIRPCAHSLSERLHGEWLGHLCGLCLALRDEHGQAARIVTNYDGLIISVLTQAQLGTAQRRTAGPCPLRGMRTATVADGAGARLAAAVSLVLASAKLSDHAADGDGLYARRPVAAGARVVARRWAARAHRSGLDLGLDTSVLLAVIAGQREVESAVGLGGSLLTVTEPTEIATAAAFAHTAVLAGRPGNAEPLAEAGRFFGRIAHLLDAVEDLAADRAAGAWNPLAATGASYARAGVLARDAAAGIRLALDEVVFTDARLVHRLLVHEVDHAIERTFAQADPDYYPPVVQPGRKHGAPKPPGGGSCWRPQVEVPPRTRGPLLGCAVAAWMCCTCQVCCRDPYPGPWSGRAREGWCTGCDCGNGDCGDCCDCLRCCKHCDGDCCGCDC
ncbi:hypothetical protein Cs7R123_03080 [Catellatospora sp. TT07R-123]|uniref:DUF5685 family protein n=1 Tax=Catellatospora sp. TT07R-123 TaxID=2733863 RepID=UPI001B26DB4D|nr:DUF5685 family protein [Catellatospora sp. TT07R-123]GHJ42966.1 hypothetical protein Cs7R123_03080 [Catellatospora sp. TT07R-123]